MRISTAAVSFWLQIIVVVVIRSLITPIMMTNNCYLTASLVTIIIFLNVLILY